MTLVDRRRVFHPSSDSDQKSGSYRFRFVVNRVADVEWFYRGCGAECSRSADHAVRVCRQATHIMIAVYRTEACQAIKCGSWRGTIVVAGQAIAIEGVEQYENSFQVLVT